MNAILDGWFKFPVGEAAFYALFGFMFVFLGIVVLILIFTLLGYVMKKMNARPAKEKKKKKEEASVPAEGTDGVSPEVVAAITAAIACYMEETHARCDFVVKRIRKI